jgi:hypothetical protein
MPAPKALEMAAEVTLNTDLRRALEQDDLDAGRIGALVDEAQVAKVPFDAPTLEFALRRTVEHMAETFASEPRNLASLEKLDAAVRMAQSLPFEVVLWRVQNMYYDIMLTVYPEFRSLAARGDAVVGRILPRARGQALGAGGMRWANLESRWRPTGFSSAWASALWTAGTWCRI